MSSSSPLVSLAINSYKNTELLRLCLESIQKNVKNISFEIIVVDGETEESTEMMMREEFPEVRFFSFSDNVGFPCLVNKSLEMCRGTYALLLNSDIIVTDGAVEALCAFLETHQKVGMVGPQLKGFNEEFQPSCFRFYKPQTILYRRTFLRRFGFAQKHIDWFLMKDYDHKSPKSVDWLMGSAFMIPMRVLPDIGTMDEDFFLYMEDVDWCRRFWEHGFEVVYYPDALMYHYHGKGSDKGGFLRSLFCNKLTWYHIASAVKYFIKYRGKKVPSHQ
jgi:GT2 family glycosyltransferase